MLNIALNAARVSIAAKATLFNVFGAEYIIKFSHSPEVQLDHPLQLRRSSEFDHGAYSPRPGF